MVFGVDKDGTVHEVSVLPDTNGVADGGSGGPGAVMPYTEPAPMSLLDRIRAIGIAAEHGAALVYHAALAVEGNVALWRAGHPEVSALIDQGVALAQHALLRWAPGASLLVAAHDVEAALHAMAVEDASVASPEKLTAKQLTAVKDAVPAPAPFAPPPLGPVAEAPPAGVGPVAVPPPPPPPPPGSTP